MIASVNPATGETIRSYPELTPGELEDILQHARDAFAQWSRWDIAQRTRKLNVLADLLRNHAKEVQRIGMIGLGLQNLPVERLRFRQATGLMVLESKTKDFNHGCQKRDLCVHL